MQLCSSIIGLRCHFYNVQLPLCEHFPHAQKHEISIHTHTHDSGVGTTGAPGAGAPGENCH